VWEERYLDIVRAVDAEFNRNRALHGDRIQCRAGCSECCHQLFRITELDAEHISRGLAKSPELHDTLQHRARRYVEVLANLPPAGGRRLACPALIDGVCTIYEFRPVICHKFGMPLYNPDQPQRILACELNFADGEEIHDPDLIQIQTGIHVAWKQLRADYAASRETGLSKPLTVAAAILR
jgi:uncharacterized protein